MMLRFLLGLLAAGALSGCTYAGGDMGDPLTRKVHWFSYVAGDDIRATCQAGTPDRFRLIYNGVYGQQVRLYDVDSVRRSVTAKVTPQPNMTTLSGDDLLAPWRAVESKTALDDSRYGALVDALAAAGAFGPPAVGLDMPSRGYHWSAASCKDGQFRFTGWVYPQTDLTALPFAAPLLAADSTGIALAVPAPIAFDPQYEDKLRRGEVTSFTLKVGQDGLVR